MQRTCNEAFDKFIICRFVINNIKSRQIAPSDFAANTHRIDCH